MTDDVLTDGLLTFGADASQVQVAVERRTISGLVLPFNVIGNNGRGKYVFTPASVPLPADPTRVKLLIAHNHGEAVGHATSFEVRDDGIWGVFKVDTSPEGDRALLKASEKTWDGLSAGIDPRKGRFRRQGDVFHAIEAPFWEVSLTPLPAFDDARATSVAASAAPNRKEPIVGDDTTTEPVIEAPTFSPADGQALMQRVEAIAVDLAAMKEIQIPVGPGPQLQVTEEPIYRFSGTEGAPSGFDFAADLLAAANGDGAALERVTTFTAENLTPAGPTFVSTGDVNEVNQPQYRPDMFVGQAPTPQSPLYDTFHKGSLSNVTPFFWSKLDRANTNVGVADHTEGVDPTAGNLMTVTGTTVTPIPVSGKVHITREVADQGGNPQVSGLVWREFERSFKIALETKTAALLAAAAASVSALATIAAGASGVVAGRAIESGLIDLQFLPDGSRFTKAFGHIDLYKALANATLPKFDGDTDGEKVYPIINPQNRDGIVGAKYSFIDLAGYRMEPTASLGATATTASNSWVADPNAVHVWNSGLQRLEKLQEKVEGWDLGVFAYFAGVVYDVTGLRKIAYDPTA